MTAGTRRKVAILGGGMGALSAAWELSAPGWEDEFESITVYQRGWRLGGKGASGRGAHGRIEEHGLHVWLGYYQNAFRMIRECYAELNRRESDPGSPIQTWDDAFVRSSEVGVTDLSDGEWSLWLAHFAQNERVPGAPNRRAVGLLELVRRALRLLYDFALSIFAADMDDPARPIFSLERGRGGSVDPLWRQIRRVSTFFERAALTALVGAVQFLSAAQHQERTWLGQDNPLTAFLDDYLDELRERLAAIVEGDPASRRTWQLVDVLITGVLGLARDGVLSDPSRLRELNMEDYRGWLARHGASETARASPLIRGLYDLGFAYKGADPARPAFPAGLGLYLSARMFFDYDGAIFWKMQAGMGDVVFAPLYQVLRARGVRFRFFQEVENLGLSADGRRIETITIGTQVNLATGVEEYEPLVRVRSLPCWPAAPLREHLDPAYDPSRNLETIGADTCVAHTVLQAGEDFDVVVFGISLGMIPQVCPELIAHSQRWRDMVRHVTTVPTQAAQLWFETDEAGLGWQAPGATLSGYVEPFDTYASMTHLLGREDWPEEATPRSLAYLCNALQSEETDPAAAAEQVLTNTARFLTTHAHLLWPEAAPVRPSRFRWEVLHDPGGRRGEARLRAQYLRANVDPSDRYVQSLPGTDRYRMRAAETGFANLYIVGDWIDSGLNAGCIESATIAGQQASSAIWGRPALEEIHGLSQLRVLFG